MYIDDCVTGILKVFFSKFSNPINLGSSEQVSINHMIKLIEKNFKLKQKKIFDAQAKGSKRKIMDNTLIKKVLKWEPRTKLHKGLGLTYKWIFKQILNNKKSEQIHKIAIYFLIY